MTWVPIGMVTHYFDRISVAVIVLSGPVRLGETVQLLGRMTEFEQQVGSLQIDHEYINEAESGKEVALKVIERVRPNDVVYVQRG